MKTNHILLLFTCFILFANFQCKDDPCALIKPQYATINALVNEEKFEYSIGDTIWLSTEFSTKFPINNGSDTLLMADGNCVVRLDLIRLENLLNKIVGFSDFKIINNLGELTQINYSDSLRRNYSGHILFKCDKEKCAFVIGLVPQRKGNYSFLFHTGGISIQDTSMCPPSIGLTPEFNVASHHREIFQELYITWLNFPAEHSKTKISEDDGAYAFKVK